MSKEFAEHKSKKRSTNLPFAIVRTILSLTMMSILSLGLYQAYKHFSGVDPLKLDPHTAIFSALSTDKVSKTLDSLFGLPIPGAAILKNKLGLKESASTGGLTLGNGSSSPVNTNQPLLIKIALVADSHNDNQKLEQALKLSKDLGVKAVIGLGDYSDVGTQEELKASKAVFDNSKLPYYLTAGDHDLWDGRDKGVGADYNFVSSIGTPYQSFSISGVRFLVLYNSDNYQGLNSVQMRWLEGELQRIKESPPLLTLAFLHEPLFHPSSDHYMGKEKASLKDQAQKVTQMLKEAGVAEVFSGDTHFFTRYQEPKTNLKMTVVGALTSTRNLQAPRFATIDVYQDGSYNISDIEVK